jgi:carbonic anhydrase
MYTRRILLTVVLVGLGIAISAASGTGQLPTGRVAFASQKAAAEVAEKAAVTPQQAWEQLTAGNDRFARNASEPKNIGANRRQQLSKGQKPFAVVLTCADSRLTPEYIFNQGLGDLFVLRVAGNIADPYVLGSVEYAVEHLQVPLVVIVGHEKCGAVEAALGQDKPTGNLGKLVGEIDVGKDLPAGKEIALATAVKRNARHQARLFTERSDVIKEYVAKKKVRIVSGVYELASGRVVWLDEL